MLRDAFGFTHVDAGDGWLIFALPPAELGVHPGVARLQALYDVVLEEWADAALDAGQVARFGSFRWRGGAPERQARPGD